MAERMRHFRYRARCADGTVINGVLAAIDAAHLVERLRTGNNMELLWCGRQWRRKTLGLRQSMDFLFQLRHSVAAGVPLLQSLHAQAAEKGEAANLAAHLAVQIEAGTSLAGAMSCSGMFDPVTVALVDCGESAGELVPVLDGIIEGMRHRDELAAQLRRGLVQPAISLLAVLAVMLTMSVWVAPALASFLESMGQQLPQHTRILLALLHAPVALWPLWLALAALAPCAWLLFRVQPRARLLLHRALLALPLFGAICAAASLARVTSMLRLLYAAGMPLPQAMDKACSCVHNSALSHSLQQAVRGMNNGQSLIAALQDCGLMPPLLLRILGAGERAGTLEAAFGQLCYLYTREVREAVAKATALVTPLLTLLLGLLLAWSAVAFISPVYELVLELPL